MTDQPHIQLLPATEVDYPVVQNLSGYYIYDFTEYLGWPCPESGRFGGCDAMFAEWQAGKNYPFLIRVDGELAGFAAVGLETEAQEFSIQEFFIMRKFRRRGIDPVRILCQEFLPACIFFTFICLSPLEIMAYCNGQGIGSIQV